jgi:hypothetical protein
MKVFFTFCFCWITVAHCPAQVFEAEKGALLGTQISTQRQDYASTGFVTGFEADKDKVTMTVKANQGIYNLYIRYAAPFGGLHLLNVVTPASTKIYRIVKI